MKLQVFKAGDGDCLLVRGAEANILVDGGRKTPFVRHVAPELEKLREDDQALDLVCVSHIDNDHITGIVELYRRRTEWAAHRAMPNSDRPTFGEPPEIKRLWHNSFDDTVSTPTASGGNGEISNQLGFHNQIITAVAALGEEKNYGQAFGKIAQGAKLAIELDLRFKQSPMHIEFNGPASGELIEVGDTPLVDNIGGINVHILSPTKQDLERLRKQWDRWVRRNRSRIEQMKAEFRQQTSSASALDFLRFSASRAMEGDFDDVTPPNLASITFLLDEGGKRILMTGDHASEGKQREGEEETGKFGLLEGLERANLLPPTGLHVDVLKVPHHGALANLSNNFVKRVTADNYVFCANGRHHNPELEVVDRYIESRIGPADRRSQNQEVGNRFKLWFNYHPDDAEIAHNENFVKQMSEVKRRVEEHGQGGKFDFEFCQDGNFTIEL